jgi:hypothetical protein
MDRLIVAATAFVMAQNSVITVDVGTATTIDAVNKEGVFLGGVILPGPRLWLESLQIGTANLPKTVIQQKKIRNRNYDNWLYTVWSLQRIPPPIGRSCQADAARISSNTGTKIISLFYWGKR